VGGLLGAVLTGVFADPAINELGKGLLYGNAGQLWTQIVASLATIAYSGVMTLVIFLVLKLVTGIRVQSEDEVEGLDESEHGERAYNL
jgi:Amt family ammonium transporter